MNEPEIRAGKGSHRVVLAKENGETKMWSEWFSGGVWCRVPPDRSRTNRKQRRPVGRVEQPNQLAAKADIETLEERVEALEVKLADQGDGREASLRMAEAQERIADHFDPPPPDIVGTDHVAKRLGLSTRWVSEMASNGEIPEGCKVKGTGHGKPWKFHRQAIDKWLASR
ncbi:MAG: helix-turn-helix domain-containing protein [Candidatus Nealsonbacteria bacterium]|nr:helix-turn-helix domain-containing protein [Candidatus Nealsonbacteria bacterium]